MFVVCVTIKLKPGAMAAFLPEMLAQAANSLDREAECHQFDVSRTPKDRAGDAVFLYEVYTDAAAFEAHLQTDHFKAFDAAVAPLISDKQVVTFERV